MPTDDAEVQTDSVKFFKEEEEEVVLIVDQETRPTVAVPVKRRPKKGLRMLGGFEVCSGLGAWWCHGELVGPERGAAGFRCIGEGPA